LNRSLFRGRNELRDAPKHLYGSAIFKQVEGLNVTFGKSLEPMDTNKRAWGKNVVEVVRAEQWRKRSRFLTFLIGR